MVDYIYKRCDRIFTSSESFITRISKRKISKDKLEFWPQYAEDFYCRCDGENLVLEIPQDGRLNLTFAGNIGYAQGLDVLIGAAIKLKEKDAKVRFNIIGDGRYKSVLMDKTKIEKVEEYFNFIDKKPATDIPKYLANSDAALVTLSKSDVFAMTIPAKMQSCMACGMPIIAALDGEAQNVINEAGCGLCCDSGDAETLAKHIFKFINLSKEDREVYAKKSIEYYNNNYNKKMLLNRMNKIFE